MLTVVDQIAEKIRTPKAEDEERYLEKVFEVARTEGDIPLALTEEVREVLRVVMRTPEDFSRHVDRAERRIRAFDEIKDAEGLKAQFKKEKQRYHEVREAIFEHNKEIKEKGTKLQYAYLESKSTYESLVDQYYKAARAADNVLCRTAPQDIFEREQSYGDELRRLAQDPTIPGRDQRLAEIRGEIQAFKDEHNRRYESELEYIDLT